MTMDDRPTRPGTRRALVPQNHGRPLDNLSRAQSQASRLPGGGKGGAGAIPGPMIFASRRSIRFGGRAAGIAAALVLAVIALFYTRLLLGPVSLSFLVPTLQTQLNSQLQGYSFHARDAILRLSSGWRLEFRLADVRLLDESNQEIAKAPFASIGVSERSLLKFSIAASRISLLGPKLLVFNTPGKGLTLTAPPVSAETSASAGASAEEGGDTSGEAPYADLAAKERMRAAAGSLQSDRQASNAQPVIERFNPAPLLSRLFAALKLRGEASSALEQIGIKDALIYFASEKGVSTWKIADFHIDLEEGGSESALRGELLLRQEEASWRASFRAVNRPGAGLYSLTASMHDIVPRTIWQSFPAIDALQMADVPVSGEARFDITHDGTLVGGEGEIKLGAGKFLSPHDKHPAVIDSGLLKVSYDKANRTLSIKPFEMRWEDSLLTMSGTVSYLNDAATNQPVLLADMDGTGSALGAPQFGVPPLPLDVFKVSASYQGATDTVTLKEFSVAAGGGPVTANGQASEITSGGPIRLNGVVSPMPFGPVKAFWPAFVSGGTREWVGSHVPAGRITGGSISVNSTVAESAGSV